MVIQVNLATLEVMLNQMIWGKWTLAISLYRRNQLDTNLELELIYIS